MQSTQYMEILEKFNAHYEWMEKSFPKGEIAALFLAGHPNIEDTDINTLAIYIPSMEDLAFENHRMNNEYIVVGYGRSQVLDIREFWKEIKNGNVMYLKMLFSPFKRFTPDYAFYMEYLCGQGEFIARMSEEKVITNLGASALTYLSKWKVHRKPSDLALAFYYESAARAYCGGLSFASCFHFDKNMKWISNNNFDEDSLNIPNLETKIMKYIDREVAYCHVDVSYPTLEHIKKLILGMMETRVIAK